MFVVGGFAESAYIQESLTSEFGRDVKVYIPDEAGMCVMKGAVLFGHDIQYITSRIARFNYGIPFTKPFDASKHDIRRKTIIAGEEKIEMLRILVHKGQRLKVSDIVSKTRSFAVGQESAALRLMSTDIDTDDPTHPSVTQLEMIIIANPNIDKEGRRVTVSLQFGSTDILMKVVDHDTGTEVQTMVGF